MDGTQREVLHDTDLRWPNDVTLDYDSQIIYWIDAKLDKLETSFVNGSGRRVLVTDFITHPFSITFYDGVLYWTDWDSRSVIYMPVNASRFQVLVSSINPIPMSVKVVALDAQPIGE